MLEATFSDSVAHMNSALSTFRTLRLNFSQPRAAKKTIPATVPCGKSNTYWPGRESRQSLDIALDFYVWRSVRLGQSAV